MTTTDTIARYSDAWLDQAEAGQHGRGYERGAKYLRTIPFEHRDRAVGVAYTMQNLGLAGRFSDAFYAAVNELRSINYAETYAERTNREWLEAEKIRKQAKWDAAAAAARAYLAAN